ncbi:MAG: hypothetical protein R2731_18625 [Nocardioides sp.]
MPSAAERRRSHGWRWWTLVLLVSLALAVLAPDAGDRREPSPGPWAPDAAVAAAVVVAPAPPAPLARHTRPVRLPGGGRAVFGARRLWSPTTAPPAPARWASSGRPAWTAPLPGRRAAAPFRRHGERIQPVFELIVTVADAHPGRDGDFAHDIDRTRVQRFVRAAHRQRALLLLDVQPGRTPFPVAARRWPGRCATRGWGWRSTRSGGWGVGRSRAG